MSDDENPEVQARLALAADLERLYSVFAEHPLKPGFDERCSPLGNRQEVARSLQSVSLRSASVEDLAFYAFKAFTTMGDIEEFNYFLPRLLEAEALDAKWHEHDTNLFEKMNEHGWRQWNSTEQAAIEEYFRALWRLWSETLSCPFAGDELISEMNYIGIDFVPLLRAWRPLASPATRCQLAQFIIEYCGSDFERSAAEIDRWLVSIDARNGLELGFYENADGPCAKTLSEAVDLLTERGC